MKKGVLLWLAVLFVFSGSMVLWAGWKLATRDQDGLAGRVLRTKVSPPVDRGYQIPSPADSDEPILTKYTLVERSGQPFSSEQLDGQVHVVSFFFANCPHTCTFQNKAKQKLHQEFAERGVRFVSITCDPDQDTPERLREYARQFEAGRESWLFLTGNMLYIRRVAAEVYQSALDHQTHGSSLLVVDKWGHLRGRFNWNKPDEMKELRTTLQELLEEESPPAESA